MIGPALATAIMASACAFSATTSGLTPAGFSGGIGGEVKNAAGIVQMGAAVVLYNRYDRVIREAFTDSRGNFAFDSLMPDLYSVRVSLTSFVPAFKRNIAVQPGIQSMLTINLAGMLSSIEIVNTPVKGNLMSEDWKWVLRSAQATRPVLRFHDSGPSIHPRMGSVFSETRGLMQVSAGDGLALSNASAQPDLGTAFALVTSLFGSNQIQVSGNVGYSAHSGLPTAGFRTTYSRTSGASPGTEITVTMRQISLPSRGGFAAVAGQDSPALRTVSTSFRDEITLFENIRLEYGASAESVTLLERLNTFSPFARLTYDLGKGGAIQVAYSSGAVPVDFATHSAGSDVERTKREATELSQDLTALASLPRVSVRDGHAQVQRNNNLEIGYRKVSGSRVYSAAVYREEIRNGALTIAGADGLFYNDVLQDLGSRSGIFDVGNFSRWGYLASVTQSLGDKLEVGLAYGRGGALTTTSSQLVSGDASDLRSLVKVAEKNWATARLAGTAPVVGTHFAASYGWADYRSLMPSHAYATQSPMQEPGLNITLRQPIPAFGFVPGRFEASADLRNLLGQGYLPVSTVDGRRILLTNAPRAVRGGLAFIF